MRVCRIARHVVPKGSTMKKLTIAAVVALVSLGGLAGASAATAAPMTVLAPCCKAI